MRLAIVALAALSAAAPPAVAAGDTAADVDGVSMDQDELPQLRLWDGGFTLRPLLRLDLDAGSFFGQDEPEGFRSGVNARRARLGLRGTVAREFRYNVTWEFGGADPNDYGNVFEASVGWTGLGWGTVRAGAFKLQHLPEFAGSSFDLLFLERTSVSLVAGSVASGTTRVAAGLEAQGERWVFSAYGTQGLLSAPKDDARRGVVGRAAGLLVDQPGLQLQLGIDGAYQFRPGREGFSDYPGLRVDSRQFLDTGPLPAGHSYAWGPEAAGRIGPVFVEALWQRVGAGGGSAAGRGAQQFEGWYVQAAVPLLGAARERDPDSGTWNNPAVPEPFNPAAGQWGALELAGRLDRMNLNDEAVRGGRQDIWSAALSWFPREALRVAVQYEDGRIALDGPDRRFQAVAVRLSVEL